MNHAITVHDVVMISTIAVGVIVALAVVAGLLALMAKGWDH